MLRSFLFDHPQGGHMPCFVPLLQCLPLICFVEIILTVLLYYRSYTHTATYHVNIQLSKSAEDNIVTAQSTAYGPHENGRIKKTETFRGLFVFTKMFLIF